MKNNIWKILCTILLIAVLVLLVLLKNSYKKTGEKNNLPDTKTNQRAESDIDESIGDIRIFLDENISKEGIVKGAENLRWNDAWIRQSDNEMEISLTLNNESETEKIQERDLTVNLLDKDNKIIYTKDVKIKEINSKVDYTFLECKIEITSPVIIYDLQIQAK